MALQLRCPKCRQAFKWDNPKAGFPDHCLLCKEFIGVEQPDDGVVVIPMPFIRSAKTGKTDKLYRDMEKGSEVRAQLAAEAAGCSVSDMSALKMTDMKDNQREGDIAAKLVPDKQDGQYFQPNGAEHAAGTATGAITINGQVHTGIEPRAGVRAMTSIQGIMGRSV